LEGKEGERKCGEVEGLAGPEAVDVGGGGKIDASNEIVCVEDCGGHRGSPERAL
jgi:hypothetical protein